jgi:hypothetical protein
MCDDGKLIYGGGSGFEYRDSRAMMRHDGWTFLCGDCACGTDPADRFDVYMIDEGGVVSPQQEPFLLAANVSLAEASDLVGRRDGWRTCVAIV